MKVYMRVFTVLSVLIFLAVGISSLLLATNSVYRENFINYLSRNGAVYEAIGGIILILLALEVIYIGLKTIGGEPAVSFPGPEGEVRIAFSAIEGFIKRLSGQIPEVKDLRPKVCVTKKGLEIQNRVILKSDVYIPEAARKIQEVIGKYVKDVLGIEDISAIRIFISRITPAEMEAKKEEAETGFGEEEIEE